MLALAAACLVLALDAPSTPPTQTLGDAARKNQAEQARKAKEKEKDKAPVKAYTEDDLRSGHVRAAAPDAAAAPAAADAKDAAKDGKAPATATAAAAPKEKTEDELAAEKQQTWRQKLTDTQKHVSELQAQVDALQQQASDPNLPPYSAERASLLGSLEEGKRLVADAQKQVADLTEEGRRNGYR